MDIMVHYVKIIIVVGIHHVKDVNKLNQTVLIICVHVPNQIH